MASSSSSSPHQTRVPFPSDPGGKPLDHDVPIHVVTEPSQLPVEFLNPSAAKELIIGFDCEGVNLCRHGALCIMQLAFPDAIYLVDAIEGGESLIKACKPALESSYITKVIHDCKRDSEALYFQFGIKLHNVVDTQIAYSLIEEQEGRTRLPGDYISFVGLLADPRYCGISYLEKEEVRVLLRQDPMFWTYRPLSEMMIRAAADDVRFLLCIYYKMMEKLNERSLWYLAVRGALYSRCFCINENNYADWPDIPPIPGFMFYQPIILHYFVFPNCPGIVLPTLWTWFVCHVFNTSNMPCIEFYLYKIKEVPNSPNWIVLHYIVFALTIGFHCWKPWERISN
ncbi:hypothetical protein NC653_017547 [Populus alba x Populus x berolinensis]|uniref:3'-5' exonuclease domain-containing protein n=1 Tax=Populus alba x Populus x berolinensis TaxID=444605 RepID=A0AAD6QQJ4_9ROSI|nr:hypothetical protein NC653_017547 [Populus alba x Populus x berolinensis]